MCPDTGVKPGSKDRFRAAGPPSPCHPSANLKPAFLTNRLIRCRFGRHLREQNGSGKLQDVGSGHDWDRLMSSACHSDASSGWAARSHRRDPLRCGNLGSLGRDGSRANRCRGGRDPNAARPVRGHRRPPHSESYPVLELEFAPVQAVRGCLSELNSIEEKQA
jgi:hypothetical protein